MKKIFLSTLLLSIFLIGCNKESTLETKTTSPDETNKTAIKESVKTEDSFLEVMGNYNYYLKTDNSIAPYKKTAQNRVCFEPAQMETANDGQLFCFVNTQEALEMLKIEKIDNNCRKYWGTAEIKIKDLSNKNISDSKTDPCAQSGDCEFNEAELVEVIKFYEDFPQCEK